MTGKLTISIQDKQAGLYFGMPANRMFFSRLVELYGDNGELVINETDVAYLIWCGYSNHCLITDTSPAFTKGNITEWVDEQSLSEEGKKVLEDIVTCYQESRFTKQYNEDVVKKVEEIKKKLTGTISNATVTVN